MGRGLHTISLYTVTIDDSGNKDESSRDTKDDVGENTNTPENPPPIANAVFNFPDDTIQRTSG
jgi:hypothetical protein